MPVHSSSHSAAALVLFCRKPAPGEGKRRLARSIGTAQAFAVAGALLECALEDVAHWPGRLIVSPAQAVHAAWAAKLLQRTVRIVPQPDGSLGERITVVDAAVRREGCQRVLIIGSDAPSMRPADLCAAAEALEHHDVVLIPAADGGVTLLGSRQPWPDLIDLPWSKPTLGSALERVCRADGRDVTLLAPSYDVDEVADLERAVQALQDDERPARRRLRALLRSLEVPRTANAAVR